ncbi:glycerol kinase [Paraglaciecola sp. 2405UD69-4]|uniref:glycerol kinase n=1 Tax=Paraglaciecola sp. 2405UD69-4 TaxID=3391836 RepID=UPI0039C9BB5A
MTTSSKLGKTLGLSATRLNYIFSELGWVTKHMKGWVVTSHGKKLGAVQSEDSRSGIPYVKWPTTILTSSVLTETLKGITAQGPFARPLSETTENAKALYQGADGHYLHSKQEVLIDNWLYFAEIAHAHRRKLPIDEEVLSDFYIPAGKVYIEYWSDNLDLKSQAQKDKKLAVYKKYGFNLIELSEKDLDSLDDILRRQLLKYGIQAY